MATNDILAEEWSIFLQNLLQQLLDTQMYERLWVCGEEGQSLIGLVMTHPLTTAI